MSSSLVEGLRPDRDRILGFCDTDTLKYIITHVFCPLRLPGSADYSAKNDHSLAKVATTAAHLYANRVGEANIPLWHSISRMMENLRATNRLKNLGRVLTTFQFCSMGVGDVLAFNIRAQNAGVIFRRQKDVTIFESFELSPKAKDVMGAEGRLICSYPGPAIEVPNSVFDDRGFLPELVNFLVHMDKDDLDATAVVNQTEESPDFKDTAHPRYITGLLTGILRSLGRPADIPRISKRIGDDVVCNIGSTPWRRSPLWLLIRVTLQTTLGRSPFGNQTYKEFMLFFMCCLAEEAVRSNLSSDLLHFMSAKISRRLRKLGASVSDWLSRTVLETCTSLRMRIEDRWKEVQDTQRVSPPWDPSSLNLTQDIQLSLKRSERCIRNALADYSAGLRDNTSSPSSSTPSSPLDSSDIFLPSSPSNVPSSLPHPIRGTLDDFLSSDGAFFKKTYRIKPYITLYDVERATEQGIDAWADQVTNNDEACAKLEILIDEYSSSASKTYANNPELLSIMLLTTIELWIALDKIAVKEIPILADYSPEVPISLLESLLFCKAASLDRLHRAHAYLSRRHSQSRDQWSTFSLRIDSDRFSVRVSKASSHLQALKARIEEAAHGQVREKVAELAEKNASYRELQKMDSESGRTFSKDMEISVHEWPLPATQYSAEVVVFELDCPISFNMWRTATLHLLIDILSPSVQRYDEPEFPLRMCPALQTYANQHPRSRFIQDLGLHVSAPSHRRIPALRKQVCMNNISTLYICDTRSDVELPDILGHIDIKGYCTYKLGSGRYQDLQKYVDSTSHTSNEAIANQADCHEGLSVHEYMAFTHLRAGGSLQWLNILRELRSRLLDFRRPEVHMLLAQAVSQVGPPANTGWAWHQEIQQPTFRAALLGELRNLVQDGATNWVECVTMDTVSFLLRRLLQSSPSVAVSQEALALLRTVRGKVFAWLKKLSAEHAGIPGDDGSHGISLRDVAAICRGTFDVDLMMIPELLRSAEDIEVLLLCAMMIHHHVSDDVSHLTAYSRLLLDRDRRLSLVLESVIGNILQTDPGNGGINLAVRGIWPNYHPGSEWRSLPVPNSHWFSCMTAPPAGQCPEVVRFNLLDGSLLVNEKPVGVRLPTKLAKDPLYKLIFGGQILEVLPCSVPGMSYYTKDLVFDHQVYFFMRDRYSNLVIQAKRKKTETDGVETMELIPCRNMIGDLPAMLVQGHAHWLNLSTSVMEIRPLDRLWETSLDNWKIDCTPGHYRMWKGHEFLVDIRSRTWIMVSSLLKPLSFSDGLIVSLSPAEAGQSASSRLSVVLPHYDLSFYLNEEGDLQSHNIRGMVYDDNQSIGTLFGLDDKLVLRPKNRGANTFGLFPRYVLIPDGVIHFRSALDHVRVGIRRDFPPLRRVAYQIYRIDTDLGCLVGNGSLTSKLYCAYLHALTGGRCVDPLTGRSGTEEALSILHSAGCWSDTSFGSRDAELLDLIASICPSRKWISARSGQKVEWCNIPASSQHYDLYILCKAIKDRYEAAQMFYESSEPLFVKFPLQDDHLWKRGARRAASLFPSRFSGQLSGASSDVRYSARDTTEADSGEHCAYIAATCVVGRAAMGVRDIWEMARSWKRNVSGEIAFSLRYDKLWLTPDLPSTWLKTYNLLRGMDERKWSRLLFSLPAMAYASEDLRELVPVFVAFASCPQFRLEDPPHYDSYNLSAGCHPSWVTLSDFVVDCAYPFERSPESSGNAKFRESSGKLKQRQIGTYNGRLDLDADAATQRLLDAWPCETPPPCSLDPKLYDVTFLQFKVQGHFSDCFRNLKLKEHLIPVQAILNNLPRASQIPDMPSYSFHPSQIIPSYIPWAPTVTQLFARPPPPLCAPHRLPRYATDIRSVPPDFTPLHQLLATVEASAANAFQRGYVSALRTGAERPENEVPHIPRKETELPTTEALLEHYASCKASYLGALRDLQLHLCPKSQSELAVEQSGQWPRITPYTLLQCLASNSPITLSDDWKRCLTSFAFLALELQRARRLLLLHFDDLHTDFAKELQNEVCDGWDPESHPDWLLIQLQGNFLIRRVQVEVAKEMISPSSGNNTAMQLNMGEGKTAVIVPIVAAILANGDQLVRIIVPKPLVTQASHILADRLGGLTNRRIYHVPFSRSIGIDQEKVTSLHQILSKCMQERGILVLQPESVLSLKLVSVEKQLVQEEDRQLSELLLGLQRWLHSRSRDILDESDEILDVRSQLIFTVGSQQHLECSPERWTTTQQVLGVISKHANSLYDLFPLGVEYELGSPGSFPHLRILQADAGQKLISWVVEDIMEGLLPNINIGQPLLHSDIRDAIRSFISCEDVPPTKVQSVKEYSQNTPLWGNLLLLRGLLVDGILLFALSERRWRVNYGLLPTRTMLAVPYRAKDVPAQRAEFGHPDVAIVLTCLCYYYSGLGEKQLKRCFNILLMQQDPSRDYALWVRDCSTVPEDLRRFSAVSIESREQWDKFLYPLFSRNQATVDFYLSRVVFPGEAKEFPLKLSSSGWDLAEKKERPLTGFSGTNDGQHLFPLDITQRDPDHQRGTNAKVLSFLLQPENEHYICTTHENGKRRTTHEFLGILTAQKPEIRVLSDVGAQMLDLQNRELAKAWLDLTPHTSAAIYFNDDDVLMVHTRDGSTQPLQSSPFAQQLHRCVVYLDDAHTRGTDIDFPSGFRAAVTLGPKVTKDRLVQGCMRMRKLGRGHSVMFFAPLEVDRRIRSVAGKGPVDSIDTTDVLHWAIRETWESIHRCTPQWAEQGVQHTSRYAAWSDFCDGRLTSEALSKEWLEPGIKTLEELYEPCKPSNSALLNDPELVQRCIDHGVQPLRSVAMDAEQEREIIHEITHERQVERPARVTPANHSVHQDVINFIKTGTVSSRTIRFRKQNKAVFKLAFETLDATSAATAEAYVWSQSVLATKDFEETVSTSGKVDDYVRPVHWIVSAKRASGHVLVILSPHEVGALLPNIRKSKKVHLHLYTPRLNKLAKPCDDLSLYSVPAVDETWTPPSTFMDELSVFAGQLYFKDYPSYIRLCRFLGIYAGDLQDEEVVVEHDGFITPKNRRLRSGAQLAHTFRDSPIITLRALMDLRCRDIDFTMTHMGKLFCGEPLSEADFSS